MKLSLGQRATLKISSDYGYGEKGHPPVIPEDADLVFDVEVLAINGKKAFYTQDEFDRYVTKLESWRAAQLEKFDAKEAFREKKTAKHGDRAGFEALGSPARSRRTRAPCACADFWLKFMAHGFFI